EVVVDAAVDRVHVRGGAVGEGEGETRVVDGTFLGDLVDDPSHQLAALVGFGECGVEQGVHPLSAGGATHGLAQEVVEVAVDERGRVGRAVGVDLLVDGQHHERLGGDLGRHPSAVAVAGHPVVQRAVGDQPGGGGCGRPLALGQGVQVV